MVRVGLFCIFIVLVGCAEERKYSDFIHEDGGKREQEFLKDSRQCTADKDKFSHKIQGRELGFEGEHAGYLGCMKLQGWSEKQLPEK
ncbi:MAG: hypothetical protein F3745_00925 [Nitrospinae bacterium]|nr:hypothetical protein [Nitrospinota bacterium]